MLRILNPYLKTDFDIKYINILYIKVYILKCTMFKFFVYKNYMHEAWVLNVSTLSLNDSERNLLNLVEKSLSDWNIHIFR